MTAVRIRTAEPAERPAVANVVDGAALEIRDALLERALTTGDVLVAVPADADPDATSRILGALVLDDEEIAAVAVRRRRRGQGVGTALVEAAAARRARLVARFDPGVRPFWESVGFTVDPGDEDDRLRGVRPASSSG